MKKGRIEMKEKIGKVYKEEENLVSQHLGDKEEINER